MQLHEITFEGQPPVDGYGPGFFRVGGVVHNGSLFICKSGASLWDGYSDLAPLIAAGPDYDVIFVGTGAEIAPLPKAVRAALEDAGVPFEVMGSPSACRTYNVLLSENRRVALAALAV
jgi:uncharacterized protein